MHEESLEAIGRGRTRPTPEGGAFGLGIGDDAREKMNTFDGISREDGRRRTPTAGEAAAPEPRTVSSVAQVGQKIRELVRRTKNPLSQALKALGAYREIDDWTFEKRYKARMSKDYVAGAFSNGNCRDYVMLFLSQRELSKCNSARVMISLADVINSFIMVDLDTCPEIINTEGFERLCKWALGLEKVFDLCRVESDHKDSKKNKCRWYLLDQYHPSARETGGIRSEEGEAQVLDNMKEDATLDKYLTKVAGITSDRI